MEDCVWGVNLADILHAVLERCEQMNGEWNHFDSDGNAVMVDVSEKNVTVRTASAEGKIKVNQEILEAVARGNVKKGDVLGVARVAGIMAAKQTWSLIPMCHPLQLTGVDLRFSVQDTQIDILATVRCKGETGVEMEALTAVSAAALTIYDMCKAIDKRMEMNEIHLETKSGGKSGDFVR